MAWTLPADALDGCSGGIFYCLAEWANNVTAGFFWTIILLAFCIVLFMATQRYGTSRSFGFASMVGLLGGFMLAIMQLMSWWVASAFILAGVFGIGVMMNNES